MSEKQNHCAQFATDVVHATKTAILLNHSWDSSLFSFTLFMQGALQTSCMLGLTSSKDYCVHAQDPDKNSFYGKETLLENC